MAGLRGDVGAGLRRGSRDALVGWLVRVACLSRRRQLMAHGDCVRLRKYSSSVATRARIQSNSSSPVWAHMQHIPKESCSRLRVLPHFI